MKVNSFFVVCALAFLAASEVLGERKESDLYYSCVQESGTVAELSDASIWKSGSYDGPQFTGSLDATDDNINFLNISLTRPDSDLRDFAFGLSDSLEVAGVNMKAFYGKDNWIVNLLQVAEGKTLSVAGNFVLNVQNGTIGSPFTVFTIGENSGIDIGGDFEFYQFMFDGRVTFSQGGTGSSVSVGGGMNISASRGAELGIGVKNFSVGGVLTLTGTYEYSHMNLADGCAWYEGEYARSFGGLVGNAKIEMDNTADMNFKWEFTNSSVCDFMGTFAKEDAKTTLDIIMNAASASGKQTLRFESAGSYTYSYRNYSDGDVRSVTVNRGELDMGMHSGMSGGYLEINGAEAVFSAAGMVSGEVGTVYFDSAWFSQGTIRIDFSELEGADKIVVANGFETPNAGAVCFELNISSEDLGVWLETYEVEYLDYTILEFGFSNISADEASKMIKAADGRVAANVLQGDLADGKLTVRLSLAAVPEPAAVAAILGALALTFAAWRARK